MAVMLRNFLFRSRCQPAALANTSPGFIERRLNVSAEQYELSSCSQMSVYPTCSSLMWGISFPLRHVHESDYPEREPGLGVVNGQQEVLYLRFCSDRCSLILHCKQ